MAEQGSDSLETTSIQILTLAGVVVLTLIVVCLICFVACLLDRCCPARLDQYYHRHFIPLRIVGAEESP